MNDESSGSVSTVGGINAVAHLIQSGRLSLLIRLNLSGNSIGDNMASTLVVDILQHLTVLQVLELQSNLLGNEFANKLCLCLQHRPSQMIRKLDLGSNRLGITSATLVVNHISLGLPGLVYLGLEATSIGQPVIEELLRVDHASSLTVDVKRNRRLSTDDIRRLNEKYAKVISNHVEEEEEEAVNVAPIREIVVVNAENQDIENRRQGAFKAFAFLVNDVLRNATPNSYGNFSTFDELIKGLLEESHHEGNFTFNGEAQVLDLVLEHLELAILKEKVGRHLRDHLKKSAKEMKLNCKESIAKTLFNHLQDEPNYDMANFTLASE
jgi:hypothetical protein